MSTQSKDLFSQVVEFPDAAAKRSYDGLVGLDTLKERLQKEGSMILNPGLLEQWSSKFYREPIPLTKLFKGRSPLFVFGGDVGTGKTALAKSFGDRIARSGDCSISLYSMSLSTRGSGAVGEMTALVSAAFAEVKAAVAGSRTRAGSASSGVVLLIDEADAIAQSREFAQMHHEDRAGVNALIRGIDELAGIDAPVLVVMCTNRLDAIDPAVRRRAAGLFEFTRPNDEQRHLLLSNGLSGVGLAPGQIAQLSDAIGPTDTRDYGVTFSDITNRLLPEILLDAFPSRKIEFERALAIASELVPTPPFGDAVRKE